MSKKKKNFQIPKNIDDFAGKELGAILRQEREKRGLSQVEVAKRIGKSATAVIYYEAGKRPIHFSKFIRFCSALRVSPGYILETWMSQRSFRLLDEQRRKEYHKTVDDMIEYGFSRDLDTLFVYFRGLIEKEKETRERVKRREQIQKEYYALKDLHGREDQGGEDV